MKRTTKARKKATATNNQYENYLAVKQKEAQEAQMMEAMQEQVLQHQAEQELFGDSMEAEFGIGGYDAVEAEAPIATSNPVANGASQVQVQPDFGDVPPVGQVKAYRTKKSPVKQPARAARNSVSPAYPGDEIADLRTLSNRGSNYGNKYNTKYNSRYTTIMEPVAHTEMEESKPLPELEASEAKLPSDIEQFDEVRNALKLVRSPERTLVYGIVVDKQNEKNVVAQLRCFGGVAFGGYARDISGDAYLVECVQAVHLGHIPFSFRLEMSNVGNWSVEIPLPERVLESAFAPSQRKTLSDLRERFPEDRFEFQYLQMLMVN